MGSGRSWCVCLGASEDAGAKQDLGEPGGPSACLVSMYCQLWVPLEHCCSFLSQQHKGFQRLYLGILAYLSSMRFSCSVWICMLLGSPAFGDSVLWKKKKRKQSKASLGLSQNCPKISVDAFNFLSSKKCVPHHLLFSIESFAACCCHPIYHLFPRLRTPSVFPLHGGVLYLSFSFCLPQMRTALFES